MADLNHIKLYVTEKIKEQEALVGNLRAKVNNLKKQEFVTIKDHAFILEEIDLITKQLLVAQSVKVEFQNMLPLLKEE
jgi:hypothetical protein